MLVRVALLALLARGAVAFAPVARARGVAATRSPLAPWARARGAAATRPRSTPEASEEPGNPLSKLFEREPEEPEPPAPEEPELARIARLFGVLRFATRNAIMLSFGLDMVAGRMAAVGRLTTFFREWLWSLVACGSVFDVLTRAAKRDELGQITPKLLNIGLLLSLMQLAISKAVTLEVIYFAMVPSVFALTRSGFRGLTARGITFSGSSLSAIYAGLSLEAASSAALQPRTLPYLRAAMLYALHLMTAPTERENDAAASHTFRVLNDALQFISFTLFPVGFMKAPSLTPALIVPVLSLYAASQGGTIGKEARKERQSALEAAPAADDRAGVLGGSS